MHRQNRKTNPILTTTTSNPPNGGSPRLVLEIAEFGDRYRVKPRVVWGLLKRGLPHFRFSPHRRLIPVPEADEWMTRNYIVQRQQR